MIYKLVTGITSYYDSERKIRDFSKIQKSIVSVLIAAGMISSSSPKSGPPESLHVLLDGRVVGVMQTDRIEKTVSHLRKLKLSADSMVCFCSLKKNSICFFALC